VAAHVLAIGVVNPKLFGAIVLVGAAVGVSASCRTGMVPPGDQSVAHDFALGASDLARTVDLAQPVDLAQSDAPMCCDTVGGDMSGCIVIPCILIL